MITHDTSFVSRGRSSPDSPLAPFSRRLAMALTASLSQRTALVSMNRENGGTWNERRTRSSVVQWLEAAFQGSHAITSVYLRQWLHWDDPTSGPRDWMDRLWALRGLTVLTCQHDWLRRCLHAYGNDLSPLTSLVALDLRMGAKATVAGPAETASCRA